MTDSMILMAEEAAGRTFTIDGPLKSITFEFLGKEWVIAESVVTQWVVMVILAVLFFILGRNLKLKPEGRRQVIAEWIVGFFTGYVEGSMGQKYKRGYGPYIGALFCFIILSCLMGLFGLRNPTADVSVTASWGIITFVLVLYTKIKTGGFKGYMKSFIEPMPFMLPFNIIGDFANPVAQALRLFGNNVSGMVIGGLVYFALGSFAIFVPAVLSLYFDLFSAVIQSYIFVTLTMSYVAMADMEE
ncbi:MAG: F0F1 ATP synthase subunit A [Ruminiclostridium sp.]|nr:F0F1 ATP synthase subunit A [Ruminiclostridium sp.]